MSTLWAIAWQKGSASIGRKIGYLRVSTEEQNLDRQILGLENICDELRIEHGVSAVAKKRPVFEQLLANLQPGDCLVIWSLDRAFRSARDAINVGEDLRTAGIHLQIVSMLLDTSTPEGKFFYTFLAAWAELERDTISQRTKEGMDAARRNGKRIGRPKKLTEIEIAAAKQRLSLAPRPSMRSLARSFGCSQRTLTRALAA